MPKVLGNTKTKISRLNIFPSHVYIRNVNHVDISTEAAEETRTHPGALTQLGLRDVSFWYKYWTERVDNDLQVQLIPNDVTRAHR